MSDSSSQQQSLSRPGAQPLQVDSELADDSTPSVSRRGPTSTPTLTDATLHESPAGNVIELGPPPEYVYECPGSLNVFEAHHNRRRYSNPTLPNTPIAYTFRGLRDVMLLSCESEDVDNFHHYCISTTMNCFVASCFVLTVRRGDTPQGQFVGDFE